MKTKQLVMRIRLLLCFLICMFNVAHAQSVPQKERDALIAIYNAMGGVNSFPHPNDNPDFSINEIDDMFRSYSYHKINSPSFRRPWQINNKYSNVDHWHGVYVRDGHVVALEFKDFFNKDENAKIFPIELLAELEELEYLSFYRGQFTVQIQENWKDYMPKLKCLSLYSNHGITGVLPAGWGNWSSLEVLRIGSVGVSGQLPSAWKNLSNLKVLLLSENSHNIGTIMGELPSEWGDMSSLEVLAMIGMSGITGELPSVWKNMQKIQGLILRSMPGLTGVLPSEWGELASLDRLIITGLSNITGELPSNWHKLINLETLKLGHLSNVTGELPSNWHKLINLETLKLDQLSNVTGGLPSDWNKFPKLKRLTINSLDKITGELPAEWSQFINLVSLNIEGLPNITGELPVEWSQFINLGSLSIRGLPNIRGTLPSEWGEITSLGRLEITHLPNITGKFPAEWSQLTRLSILDLSGLPNIEGELPADWVDMRALRSFRVYNVDNFGDPIGTFKGRFPFVDVTLEKIDVSGNSLVFSDLESIRSTSGPGLTYIPQKNVGSPTHIDLEVGSTFRAKINSRFKGRGNAYIWQKANRRGVFFDIDSTRSLSIWRKDLVISNVQNWHEGTYRLKVTNSSFFPLTLYQEPVTLTVGRSCAEHPFRKISDLPIPNGGSSVKWYESDIGEFPTGITEEALEPDYEVFPGDTFYAEINGNTSVRIAFPVPDIPNLLGREEEDFQFFPKIANATVADLKVFIPVSLKNQGITANNVTWHNSRFSPIVLASNTPLESGFYYAAVNAQPCRFKLEVEIGVPVLNVSNFQDFCASDSPTIANLVVFDNDFNLEVRWYTQPTGGNPLPATTALENNATYYGTYVDSGVESDERIAVQVQVNETPPLRIDFSELTVFVKKHDTPKVKDIRLTGSQGVVEWFSSQTSKIPLSSEEIIEDGVTYYASQRSLGQRCGGASRVALTLRIKETPPPKIILCQKFRPAIGEKYVFSGWVRQLGLIENTSETKRLIDDPVAGNLLKQLLNHMVNDFALAIDKNENPRAHNVSKVYIPSKGSREYDPLRKYIIDAPTDTFTIYDFQYLTDETENYFVSKVKGNNITTPYKRTVGFQFSFKQYNNPSQNYDVKYLTPIYNNDIGRRYPLFNNPTLSIEFNGYDNQAANAKQIKVNSHFSIDKGATNYINSNVNNPTFTINNLRFSQDVKTYSPDPDYQVMDYTTSLIEVVYENKDEEVLPGEQGSVRFVAEGQIIDGWQRVTASFVVPEEAHYMTIVLKNTATTGAINSYFDDIRVHPFDSNLKSFVYDPQSLRLQAELDENNYATFYEYDNEGGLIRVKKETERGIYTIQETRSSTSKLNVSN